MKILLTGGSGRLGSELRHLLPNIVAPSSAEFNVTDERSVRRGLEHYRPEGIVHAAAYTDVKRAETEREACWRVNVGGTRNLVTALGNTTFVHISTDYVFWGDRGGYHEDDPLGPVRNHYALSKLVAEETARCAARHLVLRTSFRPREWPYETAFGDVYTSQDYVDVIAPEIALAVKHVGEIPFSTLHIATERKSVFDLAQRRKPDVQRGSKAQAGVNLPDDISLDTTRWRELRKELLGKATTGVDP